MELNIFGTGIVVEDTVLLEPTNDGLHFRIAIFPYFLFRLEMLPPSLG